MGVSKVNFGGDTLIDLTNDSVTADMLAKGATAHDAAGERVVGMLFTTKVDDSLSATSENPVQNKVITSALESKAGTEVATESTNGLMSKEDKTKLDGVTLDTVLYTPQTLTDAQKKQARENIDAASDFVITITPDSSGGVTLDKTAKQIQEALSAGKTVVARSAGDLTNYMQLILSEGTDFIFGTYGPGRNGVALSFLMVGEQGANILAIDALVANPDGTLSQREMATGPVSDMQIATRKYVDDALDGKAGTAVATTSTNGLMSAADKAKLDGVEAGANKTIVPTALKNPHALTIKIGSTTVTYDGSEAQTVTIDDGTEVSY